MSPQAEALAFLEAMARRGVEVRAEGDQILFRPASILTMEDRGRMRTLKPHLLALLVPGALDLVLLALCSILPPDDARDLREERAAILEHQAGLSRAEAERRSGMEDR